jgi:hypothetical protein
MRLFNVQKLTESPGITIIVVFGSMIMTVVSIVNLAPVTRYPRLPVVVMIGTTIAVMIAWSTFAKRPASMMTTRTIDAILPRALWSALALQSYSAAVRRKMGKTCRMVWVALDGILVLVPWVLLQ